MKKLFLAFVVFPLQFVWGAPEIQPGVVEYLTPKLNSDRIIYFFGSYGVDPIPIDTLPFKECRIANLYSMHDDEKIMRTLAVVDFNQPVHYKLQKVHKKIVDGASIGIALRDDGWTIAKEPVYFGSIPLSPVLKDWMQEHECNEAAVHIYKLNVIKKCKPLHYCTIIEVHSPQYLNEEWLQQLYKEQYQSFNTNANKVNYSMNALRNLIHSFPARLYSQ